MSDPKVVNIKAAKASSKTGGADGLKTPQKGEWMVCEIGPECCVSGCTNADDLLMAPLSLDAGQRQAWAKLLQPDFTKLPFGFDSLAVCPAHFHPHQIVENSVKDAQGSF